MRDTVLAMTPFALLRAAVVRDVVGVNYHLVCGEPAAHVGPLYAFKNPSQFEADLVFLKRRYTMTPYDALDAHVSNSKPSLPRNAAILTFDDGFQECYTVIRPLLLEHGIPAVFFVITASLDNGVLPHRNRVALCLDALAKAPEDLYRLASERMQQTFGRQFPSRDALSRWVRSLSHRDDEAIAAVCTALDVDVTRFLRSRSPFLTSEQVCQLRRDGFTIGAHTVTHRDFALLTEDEIEREIVESCHAVCALTGESSAPFAFPFNGNSLKRSFLANLRKRHPHVGLFFDNCGFPLDETWIVGRMTCDLPDGSRTGHSNLARCLKRAYARGLVSQITRTKRP